MLFFLSVNFFALEEGHEMDASFNGEKEEWESRTEKRTIIYNTSVFEYTVFFSLPPPRNEICFV